MDIHSQDLIPTETREQLSRLIADLPLEQGKLVDHVESEIALKIPADATIADFTKPAMLVERIFSSLAAHLSADDRHRLKRALIAKLALRLPTLAAVRELPGSVLAMYPDAFTRLMKFLTALKSDEQYDAREEFFRKDVRFVLGLTVPCGARVIDLTSRVLLPSVVASFVRSKDVKGLLMYFRAGGTGPWFRHHVDSRHVSEFTEEGLEFFYRRVADLLRRYQHIRGLTGTSWYYDPKVAGISPRLAYLHRLSERGAFFLRHGTSTSAVRNATKTSETRRRLYQEGKYTPVSYSMLWPREELISWTEQSRGNRAIPSING